MLIASYTITILLATQKVPSFPLRQTYHHERSTSFLKMSKTSDFKDGSEQIENELLWGWATHASESYHDFTVDEALAIRSSLLQWYRSNRFVAISRLMFELSMHSF